MTEKQTATAFHPRVFIEAEMATRGWTRERLTTEMGVARVQLDGYLDTHDSQLDLSLLGGFTRAFGVSRDLILNLEAAWLEESTHRRGGTMGRSFRHDG